MISGLLSRLRRPSAPLLLVALLLLAWGAAAAWVIPKAPFRSGTDESIQYVALAAAKNRWATEDDYRQKGLTYFFYPPLYYLLFAPFYGDEPAFYDEFPTGPWEHPGFLRYGALESADPQYLQRVTPELDRLYRTSKRVSALFGMTALVALAIALRLLFRGDTDRWAVLLGFVPMVTLPQFFYYQTLCNNDALCNALGALVLLGFVVAMDRLARGDRRGHGVASLATAVAFGLNVLTKQQSLAHAPLMLWLAMSAALPTGEGGPRWRPGAALALGAAMAVLAFVAGGWWIAHMAAQGDWNGLKAARIGHPWAFVDRPMWELWGWNAYLWWLVRSYFAYFTWVLHGVPDALLLAYLAPVVATVAAAPFAAWRLWRDGLAALPRREFTARVWLVLGLVGTVVGHIGLIVVNSRTVNAPHGRVIFPSLVAIHVLGAGVWWALLRHRPRALAGLAVAAMVGYAAAFGWMFQDRLLLAIAMPREDLRPLTPKYSIVGTPPLFMWEAPVQQDVALPAGNLVALRLQHARPIGPQLGGELYGTLHLPGRDVALGPLAMGYNGALFRGDDLRPAEPVRLDATTTVTVTLRARKPWLADPFAPDARGYFYHYLLTPLVPGCAFAGPARQDGAPLAGALFMSALYGS
jgi:hypothetical protein